MLEWWLYLQEGEIDTMNINLFPSIFWCIPNFLSIGVSYFKDKDTGPDSYFLNIVQKKNVIWKH